MEGGGRELGRGVKDAIDGVRGGNVVNIFWRANTEGLELGSGFPNGKRTTSGCGIAYFAASTPTDGIFGKLARGIASSSPMPCFGSITNLPVASHSIITN